MQQNIVQKTKPSGWTLIELLVVMSIISMLTAMLLPSLNRAREQAKRIDCSSNLRQLTFAWYAYTVDNDGRLCSPDTNWNDGLFTTNRHHWVADGPDIPDNGIGGTEIAIKNGVLWPYTKTADLYKCKSDWTDLLRSYSLSNTMGGYDCKCGNMTTPFLNYAQISRSPERMVFIGAHSSKGWIVDGFWPISDIDPEVAGWAAPSSNNITIRHSDGCNLSFADNHCEYWKWTDPRTVEFAKRQISADEASSYNTDLQRMLELLKGPLD